LRKLRELVTYTLAQAPWQGDRLRAAGVTPEKLQTLDDLRRIPFLTRDEWMESQVAAPPFGAVLAQPRAAAVRYHTTSGTTGSRPLAVLDGPKDWEWISEMWCYALWGFGVRPTDTVFLAFSYGAFVGFWGAHYASEKLGCLTLAGGNMTTADRVRQIVDTEATVVCSTPTYALRMAQEAAALGIDLVNQPVKRLILSGEPAGSIPATKALIERQWGAKAADTAGMTEVGTIVMFECEHQPGGAHVIEDHYLEEVIDPVTAQPVPYGEEGERVVTSFGRGFIPVLRYRTRDLVCRVPGSTCGCGRTFDIYDGGIRGRVDDMKVVRGTNVYPRNRADRPALAGDRGVSGPALYRRRHPRRDRGVGGVHGPRSGKRRRPSPRARRQPGARSRGPALRGLPSASRLVAAVRAEGQAAS